VRQKHKLRVFENRVVRKILGPERVKVTGEWRKLHNEDLHDMQYLDVIWCRIEKNEMKETCSI
jgi:hypothetical protein